MRASGPHSQWVIVAAAGVLLLVALGERMKLRAAADEVRDLRTEVTRMGAHRQALLVAMNSQDLDRPLLNAEKVIGRSGELPKLEDSEPLVIYLLSPSCPFTPNEYPLLQELSDGGVVVLGVATDGSEEAVAHHVEDWGLRFPVLIGATGWAIDRIPHLVTPTSVVFAEGEFVLIEFGGLPPDAVGFLRQLVPES